MRALGRATTAATAGAATTAMIAAMAVSEVAPVPGVAAVIVVSVSSRSDDLVAEGMREAVEEAIINALVHRNWRLTSSVDVRLFSDRVEVWTPGTLPSQITIPELYDIHSSYPVNDLVLKVFDFAGIIESLGTGIKRIIDACRKNGNPPPKFEQDGATFIVTLRKRIAPSVRAAETINEGLNETINETIKNHPGISLVRLTGLSGKSRATVARAIAALVKEGRIGYCGSKKAGGYHAIESVEGNSVLMGSEGLNEGLNETINETINEMIKSNPGIGLVRLTGLSGKSRATVARAIAALVEEGRVEHRGSKKTGGYYLVAEGLREAGEGVAAKKGKCG